MDISSLLNDVVKQEPVVPTWRAPLAQPLIKKAEKDFSDFVPVVPALPQETSDVPVEAQPKPKAQPKTKPKPKQKQKPEEKLVEDLGSDWGNGCPCDSGLF